MNGNQLRTKSSETKTTQIVHILFELLNKLLFKLKCLICNIDGVSIAFEMETTFQNNFFSRYTIHFLILAKTDL